jgi:hypothetical protein
MSIVTLATHEEVFLAILSQTKMCNFLSMLQAVVYSNNFEDLHLIIQ